MEFDSDMIGDGSAIHCGRDFCDVKLVAGLDKQKFPVHRMVMSLSSGFFRALLGPNFREGQEREVTISNIDGPTLKTIIDYCYYGRIHINGENSVKIVSAASAMELVGIEKNCEKSWISELATENCVDIFLLAERYCLSELRNKSLHFICKHFKAIAAENIFVLEYPYPHFADILKCDKVEALEDLIFVRLSQWIDYEEKTRSKYASDLLKSIQLGKITQPFLLDFVESFGIKYDCPGIVTNEYHRRMHQEQEDTTSDPYRHSTVALESIFVATRMNDIITVEKYNTISNRWKSFHNVNMIGINERSNFGLILAKNKILRIGGSKGSSFLRSVDTYILDPLQKLKLVNMASTRKSFLPIFLNDEVYIFGGLNASGCLRNCECLSLTTMKMKTIQSMHYARYNYSAAILSGKIYVAGGEDGDDSYLCSVECYDPVTETWSTKANMNYQRSIFGLVEQSGMLYAMGHHQSIERYDPFQNVWTVIGSFGENEKVFRAISLRDRIYVFMSNGKFGLLTKSLNGSEWTILSLRGIQKLDYYFLGSNLLTPN